MKYLHTLKTRPHKSFNDITDDELNKYATEEFDISLTSLSTIKDIINIYSYIIFEDDAASAFLCRKDVYIIDEFTLALPIDMDILNAAFSILVKLSSGRGDRKKLEGSFTKNMSLEEQRFKKQLIQLDLFGITYKRERYSMENYSDVVSVSPHRLILPDFISKYTRKRFYITSKHAVKKAQGYLYIDFSASILAKNLVLFKLFRDNLPFKKTDKVTLNIYSITTYGLVFMGEATSYVEFVNIINSSTFKAGTIEVAKVLKHSKTHPFKSTFITDSEDFELAEISTEAHNINIITINGNGKIKYTK